MESPDPNDLLQAYLDGQLSDAEDQALEGRLKTDPLLGDWLVLLATEDTILREWAGTVTVALRTPDGTAPLDWESDLAADTNPPPAAETKTPEAARRTLRVRLAVAACILVVLVATAAVVYMQFVMGPTYLPPIDPIASLVDVYGDVSFYNSWDERWEAKSGQKPTLSPDEKIQTGSPLGLATVLYPDGTRLELTTDTTITLVKDEEPSGKHVALQEGFVMVEVPKQPEGRPLVLSSPHAEIRVAAARFNCLSTPQITTVEVDEGAVEVVRLSGGLPVSGQAAVKVEKGSYAVVGKEAAALAAHLLKPLQVTEPMKVLTDEAGPIQAVAYAPDGKSLAGGGWDGAVRLWGSLTGDMTACLRGQKSAVRALAFNPKSPELASGGDRVVRVWDLDTEQEKLSLPGEQFEVNDLAFSSDGKWLATTNLERSDSSVIKIRAWPIGGDIQVVREPAARVRCVAFAPNSQQLAAGFQEGRIKVVAVDSGKKLANFAAHDGDVLAMCFSPKGDLLASGGLDRVAKIWKWKKEKTQLWKVFKGHAREVRALAFSPDGRYLATGATDGTARLWEIATGQEVATFKHGGYAVTSVAISPDGGTLATAGWNKTIKLWDISKLPAPIGLQD